MRTLSAVSISVFIMLGTVAHAQDVNVTVHVDPMAAKQVYEQGQEAHEMVRKGYVCERTASGGCFWEKRVTHAHWGECEQSRGNLRGRICERVTPSGSAWYFGYERPLVLLAEKIEAAEGDDLHSTAPQVVKLRAQFIKLGKKIAKRLTDEQVDGMAEDFAEIIADAQKDVERAHPVGVDFTTDPAQAAAEDAKAEALRAAYAAQEAKEEAARRAAEDQQVAHDANIKTPPATVMNPY